VPRPYDRIVECAPGDRERRLARLYSGRRSFLCTDGPKRGDLLLPRLLKRCRGITLRRLSLIELLSRRVGLAREGPKSFGGARGQLKVRLRTLDLFGCDRRVGFFGSEACPLMRSHVR
jgi:hypothetical protein